MIKPLNNNILVEGMKEDAQATKSGIVLPESADKKKQSKGTVAAVGPGKLTDAGSRLPMSVKIGDKVVFKEPWSEENKFEEGDKKYFIVSEDDILGIIE